MNPFQSFYFTFVTQPQLNLLEFFYRLTSDIGWAIVLIAVFINLALWPLFASSYYNLQKTKLFSSKIKQIRELHKKDPQAMLKATGEFNKKHGITNTATFYILFIQLFFVSGIFFLVRDLSEGKKIEGLYEIFYGQSSASFNPLAFNYINVGGPASNYLWMVVLISVLSFIYGYYTLKLAPKVVGIETETEAQKAEKLGKMTKEEKDKLEISQIQEKAMQGSAEFMTLYFSPALFFFIGLSSPTGVNFYILTTTILSIIRQVFVTQYYKGHTEALMQKVLASDPETFENQNTINNSNHIDEISDLQNGLNPNPEIATKVVEVSEVMEAKDLDKNVAKKQDTNNKKSTKNKNLTTKQKSILKKKG